jgi:Vitamin K-dependent gamma-carboxylase
VSALFAKGVSRWHAWLFVQGELRTLALFRMGWALAMLTAIWPEAESYRMFSSQQYHLPLLSWAQPLDSAAFHVLMRTSALGCALAFLGLLPQLGALLVVATLGYLFVSDLLWFRNHVYLGLLFGLLLSVSPCGRAYSLDALILKLRWRPPAADGCRTTVQLIKAQVLIVYGWSAINKLALAFLDGFTLQEELPYGLKQSVLASWFHTAPGVLRPTITNLLHDHVAMSIGSCAVVLAEAFMVIGLPQLRLRRYAIAVGLALHGTIFLTMNIVTFGLLMVSTYPLFVQRAR